MKASNWRFESAKSITRDLKDELKDKRHKRRLQDLIDDINAGIKITDKRFEEQEMWAIRNPGFPGDEMGRPDDDFADDEDDDDDDDVKGDQGKNKPQSS